jgi:predicted nucleotidyltransferase
MVLSAIKFIKSKTKSAILELFFNNPEKEYYVRQLEKLTGYSAANIRREIIKLEADGLLRSRHIGKIKLYQLNKEYPLYNEIKNIITKTIGVEGGLKKLIGHLENIDFSFIYGSFAEDREKALSDVDIIVIGDIKPRKIKSLLYEYQVRIGREINSIVYTKKEFLDKIREKNHFVSALLGKKKIFIKGDKNEFGRFIQIRQTAKT